MAQNFRFFYIWLTRWQANEISHTISVGRRARLTFFLYTAKGLNQNIYKKLWPEHIKKLRPNIPFSRNFVCNMTRYDLLFVTRQGQFVPVILNATCQNSRKVLGPFSSWGWRGRWGWNKSAQKFAAYFDCSVPNTSRSFRPVFNLRLPGTTRLK